MLNEHLPPQSVIAGALRQALGDVLNDPEFVRSLAEKFADILDGRVLQERQIKLEEVRKAFHDGINSGRGNEADIVFNRLETKYTAMATSRES